MEGWSGGEGLPYATIAGLLVEIRDGHKPVVDTGRVSTQTDPSRIQILSHITICGCVSSICKLRLQEPLENMYDVLEQSQI